MKKNVHECENVSSNITLKTKLKPKCEIILQSKLLTRKPQWNTPYHMFVAASLYWTALQHYMDWCVTASLWLASETKLYYRKYSKICTT